MSDKAWHISYLSAIVGPCAATTDDGCMAWEDEEKSDFVMRLLDRDNDGQKPPSRYSTRNERVGTIHRDGILRGKRSSLPY